MGLHNLFNYTTAVNNKIKLSGGTVNNISIQNPSVVTISGGSTGVIFFTERGVGSVVNIVGYGLSKVPYGGSFRSGQVTGNWNDHVAFSRTLQGAATYSGIVLYDGVIPTECIAQPESDLSGDCMVNFIDMSKMADEWLSDGIQ